MYRNTVYCGLINITINRNVQTGCTGYVHIAAMRMMENNGCFYSLLKLSPVDVMMLSRCYETEFEFRSLMA